jgi:hypothetical protein
MHVLKALGTSVQELPYLPGEFEIRCDGYQHIVKLAAMSKPRISIRSLKKLHAR